TPPKLGRPSGPISMTALGHLHPYAASSAIGCRAPIPDIPSRQRKLHRGMLTLLTVERCRLIVERCRREMPFKRIHRSTALKKSVLCRAAGPVITRRAYRRGAGRQSSCAPVAPNIPDCPKSYRRAIALV